MNKAHIQRLKENYEKACNEYLKAFCCQYEFQYDEDAWAAGDVGTVALVGDYFIDFQDMMYMLNKGIAFEVWLRWYDYCLDAHELGLDEPNFVSWSKGCPRLTEKELQNIKDARQALEELIDLYKKNQTVQSVF